VVEPRAPRASARSRDFLRARAIVRPNALTLIAVASALLTIAVRLPFLDWPLTVDEAGYAYGARWWSEGLTLYSDDLWFDRPQGIFVAYRIGMALLGDSTEAIRIHGALWAAATTALLVILAARMFDKRVALVTGLLFAVLSGAPQIEGFVANAEIFMLTAATASAYLLWGKHWLAAGLLAGVAIALKPSGGAALLLAVWWLIHHRESIRGWAMLAVGTSVPLLLSLAHGIVTVGLYNYAYATLLFRFEVGGSEALLPSLATGLFQTLFVWVPLVAMAGLGWRHLPRSHSQRTFLAAWLATSLFGVAMGGNWWPHYFVQLIPPLTLIATAGFIAVARNDGLRPPQYLVVGFIAAALAFALLVWPSASMSPQDGAASIFPGDRYFESERAATYVRAHTTSADRIYVAAVGPDILYLAERQSTVPYLYGQQLDELPGATDLVIDSLKQRLAPYVVVLPWQFEAGSDEGRRILAAIDDGYAYDRSFGDIQIWARR
jgi:4-amino-4-deoxy-L-arabinose transferase-like glycosyltransferase